MKLIFEKDDKKTYELIVSNENIATFDSGNVHEVLSTFSIGKYAEWVCRLFAIDMKDEDEEGIGTYLEIFHKSPALLGDKVIFTSIFDKVEGESVYCDFLVETSGRLIAKGKTVQKIMKKEKINQSFLKISKNV